VQKLTASGQKHVELTQDFSLELLEAHVKHAKLDSTQRMLKLLLLLNQVKVVSKDIHAHNQQTSGSEDDAVLLDLINFLE